MRNEKLIGDLSGACFRRINIQHRIVCQVIENGRIVKIIRMWRIMNRKMEGDITNGGKTME